MFLAEVASQWELSVDGPSPRTGHLEILFQHMLVINLRQWESSSNFSRQEQILFLVYHRIVILMWHDKYMPMSLTTIHANNHNNGVLQLDLPLPGLRFWSIKTFNSPLASIRPACEVKTWCQQWYNLWVNADLVENPFDRIFRYLAVWTMQHNPKETVLTSLAMILGGWNNYGSVLLGNCARSLNHLGEKYENMS